MGELHCRNYSGTSRYTFKETFNSRAKDEQSKAFTYVTNYDEIIKSLSDGNTDDKELENIQFDFSKKIGICGATSTPRWCAAPTHPTSRR